MEVGIPFESSVVRFIFNAAQLYDLNKTFPVISEEKLKEILECLLFLGFDAWLEQLAPQIAMCLRTLDPIVLRQFPLFLRPLVINAIPISRLDPDFVIEHFGLELLANRVRRATVPKSTKIPFTRHAISEPKDAENRVADYLMHYDCRFRDSEFVKQNCIEIFTKSFINLSDFVSLASLTIYRGSVENISLVPMLVPTLRHLEITKTKLSSDQFQEVFNFVRTARELAYLSLRETKMGALRCECLVSICEKNEVPSLRYLDVSSNGIGGATIERLLQAAKKTQLEGLAVDANFFVPAGDSLRNFIDTRHRALSLRGIHWDTNSAEVISTAMQSDIVKFWDLSAQVVHMHSDPDLSAQMSEFILKKCNPDIESLFFSNHRLLHMDLTCIIHANLKALGLSNSNLQDDSLATMQPLFHTLEFLDLSNNAITLKDPGLVTTLATSRSLRFLSLSFNDIGDISGRILFDQLLASESQIKTLRLRSCFLRNQSSHAVIRFLGSGKASLHELDIGCNEMFHTEYKEEDEMAKSRVEYLFVGGNNPRYTPLAQLLDAIKGMIFIDMDHTQMNVIVKAASHCTEVVGISTSFSKMAEKEIIDVLKKTRAQELWIVHATSQKTLDSIIARYREIPLCMAIHIGTDIIARPESPIPLIVESDI